MLNIQWHWKCPIISIIYCFIVYRTNRLDTSAISVDTHTKYFATSIYDFRYAIESCYNTNEKKITAQSVSRCVQFRDRTITESVNDFVAHLDKNMAGWREIRQLSDNESLLCLLEKSAPCAPSAHAVHGLISHWRRAEEAESRHGISIVKENSKFTRDASRWQEWTLNARLCPRRVG